MQLLAQSIGRHDASGGRWHRIAPLVLLVAGLHVALLIVPMRSSHSLGTAASETVLRVRTLTPMLEAKLRVLPSPTAAPAAEASASPTALVRDAFMPESLTRPREAAPKLAPGAISPPQPLMALVLPGIDVDEDYFPRAMLSLVPRPVEPVLIDYPPIDNDEGHYSSELILFIDERGQVARVKVDGDALPPALEAAARSAFLSARFHAGEVEGRAVKSRIRVEVVFDSRPIGTSS